MPIPLILCGIGAAIAAITAAAAAAETSRKGLVSRICGDIQVPATCQVHDIRRFVSISGSGNRRLFS